MHIIGSDYIKLRDLGYIKSKSESELGYLCSDLDDKGIIIQEKNLAPKSYYYEYINSKDEVKIKENSTMKYKGIPKKCLKYKYYEEEEAIEVAFDGLKKK